MLQLPYPLLTLQPLRSLVPQQTLSSLYARKTGKYRTNEMWKYFRNPRERTWTAVNKCNDENGCLFVEGVEQLKTG